MPLLLALRRSVGRLLASAGHAAHRSEDAPRVSVVPATVRARTEDGADIRLLLDISVSSQQLPDSEVRRTILALVVPTATAWVRRQQLATLEHALGPRLRTVEESECHSARELGVDLLAVEVVAVEHLLVSPSAPGWE